jgi:hypothetical protein
MAGNLLPATIKINRFRKLRGTKEMVRRKIAVAAYYVLISVLILVFSVVIPLQQAEKASVDYMNARLTELKKERGVAYLDEKSEIVKSIFDTGRKLEKEQYKELSGMLGILACIAVLLLTLFLPLARLNDLVWIGGGFSALYGLGALNTQSFVAILLLVLVAYKFKKWRIKPS